MSVNEIIEAQANERARLAAEISAELRTIDDVGIRAGLAIAESIVRRGRRLTESEKFKNLCDALAEIPEPPVDLAALLNDVGGGP